MCQYFARTDEQTMSINCSATPRSQVTQFNSRSILSPISQMLLAMLERELPRLALKVPSKQRGCQGNRFRANSFVASTGQELTEVMRVNCSVFSAIGNLALIVLSPMIGRASDVYGRKVRYRLVPNELNGEHRTAD